MPPLRSVFAQGGGGRERVGACVGAAKTSKMAAVELLKAKAQAVLAYAEQFDFVQGELPLSRWEVPAVRARRRASLGHPASPARRRARRARLARRVAAARRPVAGGVAPLRAMRAPNPLLCTALLPQGACFEPRAASPVAA